MKRLIGAAIALSLATASVAMADEHRDHNDRREWSAGHREFDNRRHNDHDWQRDQRNERDWRADRRHDDHLGWHDRFEWQERRGWW